MSKILRFALFASLSASFSACDQASLETDTGAEVDATPSYAPDGPCGPELWTIDCPSCSPAMPPKMVVVRCEFSSDHLLDALQQAFGDYAAWREENPHEDLSIQRVHADRKEWRNG